MRNASQRFAGCWGAAMGSEDTGHAPRSPSHSATWLNCPGSVEAEKPFPDETSEFALEGTAAHMLAEKYLRQGAYPGTYVGSKMHLDEVDRDWVVDEDMDRFVQQYVDYVRRLPGKALVERRVSMEHVVPGCWGTADALILHDKLLTVVDLKYGRGVRVFAKDNTQMMLYALGAVAEFGFLYEIERCRLVIVQPRLGHIDEWEVAV